MRYCIAKRWSVVHNLSLIHIYSERRDYFHETDEDQNKKAKALVAAGLVPVFCLSLIHISIWATSSARLPPVFPAPAGVPAIWSRLLRALPLVCLLYTSRCV